MIKNRFKKGFTIVELLVVIVVIGILASITIISYTGFTARANAALAQSDLSNMSRTIEMYKIDYGQYPAQTSDFTGMKGYAVSKGNTLLSYVSDKTSASTPASLGSFYCITTKANNLAYSIKNGSAPVPGYCMTNLIMNGDFSNGTVGWTSDTGSLSVVGGAGQSVSVGTHLYQDFKQNFSRSFNTNNGMYVRYKVRSNDYAFKSGFPIGDDGSTGYVLTHGPDTQSVWFNNKIVWPNYFYAYGSDAPWKTNETEFFVNTYNNDNSNINPGSVIQLDNVVFIDTTSTFGYGNEPSSAKMDVVMAQFGAEPWFEGTVIVNL